MRKQRNNSSFVKASNSDIDPSMVTAKSFVVTTLPGRNFASPLIRQKRDFVERNILHDREDMIMFDPRPKPHQQSDDSIDVVSMSPFTMRLAAPRASLHFNPGTAVVAIVTCGGLCPGLNDVIRGITLTSIVSYHVRKVIGYRYGYWGLSKAGCDTAIELTPDTVRNIHRHGGTFLGSSRGGQDINEMIDTLVRDGVSILFAVGGDGTQKGALAISKGIERRGLDIAVMGIPKTIDNDLSFSHRTFGYETAVEEAVKAIRTAHAEATSQPYGVGLVKLMGRESGFIAAAATVSSSQAHICLVPEMPISREVFLRLLERRFEDAEYVVVVVAEGFGQNWEECKTGGGGFDQSGNKKLKDIGMVIKKVIEGFLKSNKKYRLSTVKYIDPSYMIRAVAANASDAFFCSNLCTLAVHEAMAGCTGALISLWYSSFVVVPIKLCVSLRKIISVNGALWRQVREITVNSNEGNKDIKKQEMQREAHSLNARKLSIEKALSKI